jgi:hypothetical protein
VAFLAKKEAVHRTIESASTDTLTAYCVPLCSTLCQDAGNELMSWGTLPFQLLRNGFRCVHVRCPLTFFRDIRQDSMQSLGRFRDFESPLEALASSLAHGYLFLLGHLQIGLQQLADAL